MGSKLRSDFRAAIRANLMTKAVTNLGHWPDDRLDPIIEQAREWTFGEVIAVFDSQDDTEVLLTTDVNGNLTLPDNFVREVSLRKGAIGDGGSDFVEIVTSTSLRTRHPNHDPMGAMDWKELWRIVGTTIKQVRTVQPIASGSTYVLCYVSSLAPFTDVTPGTTDKERMSDRVFNISVWKGTELCIALTQNMKIASYWAAKAQDAADKIKAEVSARSLSTQHQIEDVMGYGRDEDSRYTGNWW